MRTRPHSALLLAAGTQLAFARETGKTEWTSKTIEGLRWVEYSRPAFVGAPFKHPTELQKLQGTAAEMMSYVLTNTAENNLHFPPPPGAPSPRRPNPGAVRKRRERKKAARKSRKRNRKP